MFFETNEINQAYQKIHKQYDVKKQIIVAPCRCKLYVSRSSEVIDCEGKTSPNWFLFATGLAVVVYDSKNLEISLNLFDLKSVRLTWMMRLTDDSHMYAPNSNFHVINTKSDYSEHVGLLYDSKDVAAIFLENLSKLLATRAEKTNKICDGQSETRKTPDSLSDKVTTHKSVPPSDSQTRDEKGSVKPKKKQNKIIRSLSMYFKRSSRSSSKTDTEHIADGISQKEETCMACEADCSKKEPDGQQAGDDSKAKSGSGRSRYRERRRMRHGNRSKTLGAESFPHWPDLKKTRSFEDNCRRNSFPDFVVDRVEDIFPSREQISSLSENPDRGWKFAGNLNVPVQNKSESGTSSFKQIKRSNKKLNRSLSERRPNYGATAVPGYLRHDGVVRLREGARAEKPRATSDTLLLKGSTIPCLVETGHMAKYQRERKQWMAILEKGNVQTTDLCVTEL